MPCHTKFEQFLEPVSSLAKQRGLVHRQQACTGWHFKLCTPPVFSSLWSRESEVNNVCWKCPHRFNSDPRPVDCTRSRSLVGERFSMLQRKPLTDQMFWQPIADQSPTGRRSSTIICRPPNSFEKHPKKSGCRRSARGCRCNSLTTNRRLVGDHRQTFADLWQPPATTHKKVVVRGRRLVVAIVWLYL